MTHTNSNSDIDRLADLDFSPECSIAEDLRMSNFPECHNKATHIVIWHDRCATHLACGSCSELALNKLRMDTETAKLLRKLAGFSGVQCKVCGKMLMADPIDLVQVQPL